MRCHIKPNKLPIGLEISSMQMLGLLYTIHCVLLSADIGVGIQGAAGGQQPLPMAIRTLCRREHPCSNFPKCQVYSRCPGNRARLLRPTMDRSLTSLLAEDCCNGGGGRSRSSCWHGGSEASAALDGCVEDCLLCLRILLHHTQRRPCMHRFLIAAAMMWACKPTHPATDLLLGSQQVTTAASDDEF